MNSIRQIANSKAFLLGLVAVTYGFFVWSFARQNFNGNLSGFLYVGTKAIYCPEAWYDGIILRDDEGFDGEFTYYLALDPFLKKELYRCTLADGYRYQRILLPWMTAALGMGKREIFPALIVLLNIAFIIFGTYAMMLFCEYSGVPRAVSLFYPLSMGVLTVLSRSTNEIVSGGFVAAGLYSYIARKDVRWTALFLSLAVLSKEVALAAAAGILIHGILEPSRRKKMLYYLIPFAVFFAWQAYLYGIFGRLSAHQTNLSQEFSIRYPFQGLVDKFLDLAGKTDWPGLIGQLKIYVLVEPVMLAAIFAAIALLLCKMRDYKNPVSWVGLFYLILVHVAQSVPPAGNDLYGYGRHTFEIFLVLLVLYITERKKIYLIPLVANTVMTAIKYYTLIKT